MKILCIGDVVGPLGVDFALKQILKLKKSDFIIANIENSAAKAKGFSEHAYKKLSEAGVSIFTGGNHSFDNKLSYHLYDQKNMLRPCNFPYENPGKGYSLSSVSFSSQKILCINVQLRTFMREQLSCPFRAVDSILSLYKNNDDIIIVIDLHGEATAEKLTFSHYFDGKVSAIFGTHTHVQTADARVLPKGTGYITDVGMVGALDSSLGIKFKNTLYNFFYQMPTVFELEEEGQFVFSAIEFTIDPISKKCTHIERIFNIDTN